MHRQIWVNVIPPGMQYACNQSQFHLQYNIQLHASDGFDGPILQCTTIMQISLGLCIKIDQLKKLATWQGSNMQYQAATMSEQHPTETALGRMLVAPCELFSGPFYFSSTPGYCSICSPSKGHSRHIPSVPSTTCQSPVCFFTFNIFPGHFTSPIPKS